MRSLRLAHLYPALMNLYGDRGNITVLSKRCLWRGIQLEIDEITIGSDLEGEYDLAFIGGGQDREQMIVYEDLLGRRDQLREMISNGLVVLAVCGGYQLLGHKFITYDGKEIPGLGLLDATTVGGERRLIGNVVAESNIDENIQLLVGFENHSGRTSLGPGARPLAKIKRGFGNNGEDGTEGAVQGGLFGTYLHGSLLPKNPWLADHLLRLAIEQKYGSAALGSLDDSLEKAAQADVAERIEKLHRRRWVPAWFKR